MPELPELELDEASHVYRLDGTVIPGCTAVLAAMGATPGFNFLSPDELEFYRSRGHAVARGVELSVRGELDKRTMDKEEVRPYIIGWERAVNDHKIEVLRYDGEGVFHPRMLRDGIEPFAEKSLHHPAYRYGVTPDMVVQIGSDSGPLEIKATSAHSPATGLQLASQRLAALTVIKWLGKLRIGLRLLKKEPYYDLRYYTDRSDEAVWISMLNTYNWRAKWKLL